MKAHLDIKAIWKVSKKLLRNPGNLIFIFQILYLTNASSLKWAYNKLLSTDQGSRVVFEHEEISSYFAHLKNRPDNSVGKECANKFSTHKDFLAYSRRKDSNIWLEDSLPYSWLARRYRDTHDFWHILTGYDTDYLGEMCLAMFSFAQTKSLGWLLISLIVCLHRGFMWSDLRLLYEAYVNGKNAEFLLQENYNNLLNEDVISARVRLKISTPRKYNAIIKNR